MKHVNIVNNIPKIQEGPSAGERVHYIQATDKQFAKAYLFALS